MTEFDLQPISFFLAVHKNTLLPPPCKNFIALGIGGYQPNTFVPAVSDSVGDSISQKNVHYSELTGWYWIWKNVRNVKIIGLCHYRRYFVLDENEWWLFRRRHRMQSGLKLDGRLSLRPKPEKIYFRPDAQSFAYLTAPERTQFVKKTLSEVSVIVPRRQWLGSSLSRQYASCHVRDDWDLFIQGIEALYPQYSAEIKWFDKIDYLHPYNMMIASRDFFDTYMSSLFRLLFWMEEQSPFRTDPYQCRVPAFLAERFLTFYLYVTGTRYTEVPIAISEEDAF